MDDVCTQVVSAYEMIIDYDQKAQLEELLESLGCYLNSPDDVQVQRNSGGAGTTDPDRD
jgi:hypothetical protein